MLNLKFDLDGAEKGCILRLLRVQERISRSLEHNQSMVMCTVAYRGTG